VAIAVEAANLQAARSYPEEHTRRYYEGYEALRQRLDASSREACGSEVVCAARACPRACREWTTRCSIRSMYVKSLVIRNREIAMILFSQVLMTDLDGKFVYMNNQYILRTSALRGALIGVAIAFAVIFLRYIALYMLEQFC